MKPPARPLPDYAGRRTAAKQSTAPPHPHPAKKTQERTHLS
jgi:hypothetical protein